MITSELEIPRSWRRRARTSKSLGAKLLIGVFLAVGSVRANAPLEVNPDLHGMLDHYLTPVAQQQLAARASRVAAIRTEKDVAERQEFIRARLLEQIGGFPEKTPLNPRIVGTLDRDGYRVGKLIFESQSRFYVTANVYVPKSSRPPYPAETEKGQILHFAHFRSNEAVARSGAAQALVKRLTRYGLPMFSRADNHGFEAVVRRFISAAIATFQRAPLGHCASFSSGT